MLDGKRNTPECDSGVRVNMMRPKSPALTPLNYAQGFGMTGDGYRCGGLVAGGVAGLVAAGFAGVADAGAPPLTGYA